MLMHPTDTLTRFVFENSAVRGELISLDEVWREVLHRTNYPGFMQKLLGELTAAAGLLIATLKFEGSLTVQMQSEGVVRLLVVEVTSSRTVRAMAKWDEAADDAEFSRLMADGQLIITLNPETKSGQSYQGVVPLTGGSIADALMHYMRQSEQIETHIVLAADAHRAAGMLIQRLPDLPAGDADAWVRVSHLAATLKAEELLTLDAQRILHRLFHEETVRVFDAEAYRFQCTCSRVRVAGMLKLLGREEIDSILSEQGKIEVQCEFCNQTYQFDVIDAAQLWLPNAVLLEEPRRQ